MRTIRYQCDHLITGMRRKGAWGGGLECRLRDVGVLKNLDVPAGSICASVAK